MFLFSAGGNFSIAVRMQDSSVFVTTDLHSCYDRIVHTVASLTARRHGVEMSPIIMMLETLRKSINLVRTAYGDSDRTYCSGGMTSNAQVKEVEHHRRRGSRSP